MDQTQNRTAQDSLETMMKFDNKLPRDFTGVFYFTNPSDEEFVAKWNSKEYHFPPKSTSPMIMPEHSPLEIQHIRKKFAKDLAEREFFKSDRYEAMRRQEGEKVDGMLTPRLNSIHQGVPYVVEDLTTYIQKCLIPLSEARAIVTNGKRPDVESKLTRNDDGELNTVALDKKTSLASRAQMGQGLPQDTAYINAVASQANDTSNPVIVE